MTREEYLALPSAVALGILLDLIPSLAAALAKVPKPKPLFPPRYDRKLTRKAGQYSWCSEITLEDLRFWHQRRIQPTDNEKWAVANKKDAEELAKWIAWRAAYPDSSWRGVRDSKQVVAAPPSRDAALYDWKRGPKRDPEPSASVGADEYGPPAGADDGFPF